MTFSSGETNATVLSGFTLQNTGSQLIWISSASPTVKGNVIGGNTSPQYSSSGIYIQSGGGIIQGNLIVSNRQSGIQSYWDTGIQIIGNVIQENTGPGISLNYSYAADLVQQNTIVGNGTGFSQYGFGYPLTVIQNVISGNQNTGVNLNNSGGTLTMVSNTIADNQFGGCCGSGATELTFYGISDSSALQNNLLVATGNQSALWCGSPLGAAVFASNNVFAANNAAYGGSCTDQTGNNGNLSADPLFVDLLGENFHIQSGSPVVNAGTSLAANEPATDMDGDARVLGGTIDIGADEYKGKPTLALSSYALHFAGQNVGTNSAPQTVKLTNFGSTAVNLGFIATAAGFSQTNNCGSTLAAGKSCQISVVFSPVSGGTISSAVGIFTSASVNPLSVSLVGTGMAPQIQIPCCFYFYNQVIGTQNSQSGTITNVGQAPLVISSIAYNGAADFAVTHTCPLAPNSLAPGATCTITVTYAPTVVGSENGTITFSDNSQPSPQTLNVSGSSVSAGIPTFTPNSLTFPTTLIGQTSTPQSATLSNAGTGPMTIYNIYASGDFPMSHNCPASLAPGASCTVTVNFAPTNQGNESGWVNVNTDSAYYYVTLSLTGTGQAPVPTISSLSVSAAPAGSPDTQVTMTGSGFVWGSRVLWNGVQLPYSNNYGNTQMNFTIPAANLATTGTNQISVFTPEPGGGISSSVPFVVYTPVNYAFTSVSYKYRSITGTNLNLGPGGAATIQTPFPIQYGGGSFTSMTIGASGTISFSGFAQSWPSPIPTTQTTTLIAPFWAYLYPFGSGQDNNVFWAVTGTAPDRQLVVEWRNVAYCCAQFYTVKFEVVFSEGNGNVQFNYADTVFGGNESGNDNGATASIGTQVLPTLGTQFSYFTPSLSNNMSLLWYPNAPNATLSTSTLDFGYHKIGSASRAQKFTLTNGGLAPLDIVGVSINSADFAQTNDCGATVAPGKGCTFLVTFNPSMPIAETATLTINDNAVNAPQTVSLSGIGAIQGIVIFPIQLNFGGVTVGQSLTLPVTLANAANQKLTIQQIAATPAVFSQTNNCGAVLNAGDSCTVNVTFTPTQPGMVSGKLLMGLNSKAVSQKVKFTGSGQ